MDTHLCSLFVDSINELLRNSTETKSANNSGGEQHESRGRGFLVGDEDERSKL